MHGRGELFLGVTEFLSNMFLEVCVDIPVWAGGRVTWASAEDQRRQSYATLVTSLT